MSPAERLQVELMTDARARNTPDQERMQGVLTGLRASQPQAPLPDHLTDQKHSHYHKPCPYPSIDVYRVLEMFEVTSPSIQHAVKKLLVAGGRGGGKDIRQDIQEAIDTLVRWQQMRAEDLV